MRRAAGRLFLLFILIATFAGVVSAASNDSVAPALQSGALLPAIASFSADSTTVNYADVEAGTAQVKLTWNTINTNGQYLVVLEAYYQNYWVSLARPNEALPLNGSRTVPVTLPQNFGAPTFRLTLKTSMGQVIGQQFVTLSYAPSAQDAPGIVSFTTTVKSVDTNILLQGNTRLAVSWEIKNRTPDTLIRFEEVFADGSTVSAEPPRHSLWLPSKGDGAVIPRATASKDDLVFRMSLVNVNDGTVYDHADLTLPVIGNVVAAAPRSQSQSQANTQGVQTQSLLANGGPVTDFSAESTNGAPGGSVVLNWNANGADNVDLLETVGDNGPKTLYIQLPPTGSMTLPVPADSPEITYTLHAHAANGDVTTSEVNVTPSTDQSSGGG